MKFLDSFLNQHTMYRVVVVGLVFLSLYAFVLSLFNIISYKPYEMIASLAVILVAAVTFHYVFKRIFKAPSNIESSYITAFLLFLILSPEVGMGYTPYVVATVFIAIASKYVIALRLRHIFNPVAIALVVMSLASFGGALWWVATPYMLPAVLLVGYVVIRKIEKERMVLTYLVTFFIAHSIFLFTQKTPILEGFQTALTSWPIIFFATFMLTEPLTTPPRKKEQMLYASGIGILTGAPSLFGSFYFSPEIALTLGNLYSFLVSAKGRAILVLKEKKEVARDTFEFIFHKPSFLSFTAGQYMEWTLPHSNPDTRSIRRFFTISSSPLDTTLSFTAKFFQDSSSFKQRLMRLLPGEKLHAVHPAGDFVLPEDRTVPLIFVAGGIGITPFVSMIRYLDAQQEKRDITLIYANKSYEEIAFKELFTQNAAKTIYLLPEQGSAPATFVFEKGFITKEFIAAQLPNIAKSHVYISGPRALVENYSQLFKKERALVVRTDFFPGFV